MANDKTKDISKEKLESYIKQYLAKGYSKDYLKKFLIKKGYAENLVNSTVNDFKEPFKFKNLPTVMYVLGILIVITVATIFLLPTGEITQFGQKDCGVDKACFLAQAQQCKEATVREDLESTTILYSSSTDCILTKKMEKLADTEPEEVVALFEGNGMICQYEKLNLDETWVNGLLGGIEYCEGDLKDSIYELRIAQLSLEES